MPISGGDIYPLGFGVPLLGSRYSPGISARVLGLVSSMLLRDSVILNRTSRIAVAVPIFSAFAVWRQEAPWPRSCRTCSGVTVTRGRPTVFFVAVWGGVIATPQSLAPDGRTVRP